MRAVLLGHTVFLSLESVLGGDTPSLLTLEGEHLFSALPSGGTHLLMFLAEAQWCKRVEWESGELRDEPRGASPGKAPLASGSTLGLLPVRAAKAVACQSHCHIL